MGGLDMAGRFEGLSDVEWKLFFEDIFLGKKGKAGECQPFISVRF
jgi:hypothetical protein